MGYRKNTLTAYSVLKLYMLASSVMQEHVNAAAVKPRRGKEVVRNRPVRWLLLPDLRQENGSAAVV
jgi:hypothetical protein